LSDFTKLMFFLYIIVCQPPNTEPGQRILLSLFYINALFVIFRPVKFYKKRKICLKLYSWLARFV